MEKEEKKDLTRKRISVLISADPQEEKKIRFDESRRTTTLWIDQSRQSNLIKNPEKINQCEEVMEHKQLPVIKEAPKRLKTILIHNEEFSTYLQGSYKLKGNINLKIILSEEEMKSLLQAKSLMLK